MYKVKQRSVKLPKYTKRLVMLLNSFPIRKRIKLPKEVLNISGYNTKYYKKPKPLCHISPKPLNHTIFQNYN